MNYYLIKSGKWITRTGTFIARSSLHAVQIAEEVGVHKKGSAVLCLLIDEKSLPMDARSLIRLGCGPGQVILHEGHFVVVRK